MDKLLDINIVGILTVTKEKQDNRWGQWYLFENLFYIVPEWVVTCHGQDFPIDRSSLSSKKLNAVLA